MLVRSRASLPVLALLVAALAAPLAAAQSASDDFNRPDSTNMGPDWIEDYGDTAIKNQSGVGASGPFTKGFMHHASFVGDYAVSRQSVDFTATGVLDNVVLLAGLDPNTWGCVSVKLQDNDGDKLMDRLFFEGAFNAGSWGGGVPVKYDLATPTASGRLTVYFDNGGDTVVCEIANAASGQTEVASASGILSFTFPITGKSFGIGHSGAPLFDDWTVELEVGAYGAGCPGSGGFVPALKALGAASAGAPLSLAIDQGPGGASGLLFFGLNQAQVPMGFGCNLLVSPLLPVMVPLTLGGSGPGAGSISFGGTVPLSASGVTFTLQAFFADPGVPAGFTNTNGLEIAVP